MYVSLKNVTKKFGDFTAISNLSLEIADGSFHILVGPSGSGKTTLLRILAGLENASSGNILFNGKDVTNKPAGERAIGMVFQNYALWPHMTVEENISYALKIKKISTKEIKNRVCEILEMMHISNRLYRYPSELSGGEQQRVALARALVIEPSVLLFDEPLSNLDAKLRMQMRINLVEIQKKVNITAIYVTHDQKEALSMGTDVTVMHKGKVIQTAPPRELYLHPTNSFIADFIGVTNLIAGTIISDDGDISIIKSNLGLIKASSSSGSFRVNDNVLLSIRPESIKIDLGRHDISENKNANIVEAKLSQKTYLGDSEELLLNLSNKETLKVQLFNVPDYDIVVGDKIKCFFKANKVTILPNQIY